MGASITGPLHKVDQEGEEQKAEGASNARPEGRGKHRCGRGREAAGHEL